MKMSPVSHYCQKCLAANPLGQEFCARCGTRLMIVVETSAARYEVAESAVSTEEHLLERISSLENRQARLTEKLERALDLLLRQAQNSHFDRALVKALTGLLADDGIIQNDRLEQLWIERCQKDAEEQQECERRAVLRLRILSTYLGSARAAFEQQVNEGFLLIDDDQPGRGMRALQRAADLARANAPLLSFLGEYFFKSGKTDKAQEYLSRAFEVAPKDERIQLLLGLACADEGNAERAKELLRNSTRLGGPAFAAHFGLGRLFAAEQEWQKAVHEFKLALASKVSPEAHYALGRLYYQLKRDSLAARHLRKAVELDDSYQEALHLLGLLSERAGASTEAMAYFAKAGSGRFVSTSVVGKVKRRPTGLVGILPGFRMLSASARKLIRGGDRRLVEALRRDALSTVGLADKSSEMGRR